jgi:WD40 repeat protein
MREMLQKVFRNIDQDNSGSIDVKELGDAMRLLGVKCTANSARKVLKMIDTDGNGTIEIDEFLQFFATVNDPEQIKQLLAAPNQKFMDYRTMVENDPSFGRKFYMPEDVNKIASFDGHAGNVECVAWLNGSIFVTGSLDGSLKFWNAAMDPATVGTRRQKVASTKPIRSVDVSPSGIFAMSISADLHHAALAIGSSEMNVLWWDLRTGTAPELTFAGHTAPVFCVSVSPDSSLIASGSRMGHVCLHRVTMAGQQAPLFSEKLHEKVVSAISFAPEGDRFCSGSYDGFIYVYSVKFGDVALLQTIEDAASTGMVFGCVWNAKGEVYSCGDDFCIKRWDINCLHEGSKTNFFGHTCNVTCVTLSPKSKNFEQGVFLMSGGSDGCARLWVTGEMEMLQQQRKEAAAVIDQVTTQMEQEERKDGGDADVMRQYIQQLEDSKEIQRIAQLAIEERETMYCLQARRALDGHKLGITDIAFRFLEDDRIAEVLTASSDQSCKLFRFHVPNPNDIRPPAQTVKSSPVSAPASPRSPRSTLR